MKKIPFCEPSFDPSYAEAVRRQILSGWAGPGPNTSQFASAISSYVGSRHCLLTTSGTVALTVAAKALGLKPGDEILVPAYGVISTINAFASIGLNPRLVDIERSTGCMSPANLARRVRRKTRAICFVNFSGYTGPAILDIVDFCKSRGLPVIEDAACAFGQVLRGKYAGTFGTIGTYSFSVPKIITTGQGGALVTYSAKHYEAARRFIDQGDADWRKTNLIRGVGTNLRYNDILASFGFAQLRDIGKRIKHKKIIYEVLRSKLGKKIFAVPGKIPPLHNIVFTTQAGKLVKFLNARGVMAVRQYRTISQHPAYAHLSDSAFPGADFWTRRAVYLPFGLSLTPDDAERIAKNLIDSGIKLDTINRVN